VRYILIFNLIHFLYIIRTIIIPRKGSKEKSYATMLSNGCQSNFFIQYGYLLLAIKKQFSLIDRVGTYLNIIELFVVHNEMA
jgi:hypothetical protein